MGSILLKQVFCCFLVITISRAPNASSRSIPDHVSVRERHEEWMSKYGRQYKNSAEKEMRYEIFSTNVEYIDFVNSAGNKPYKLAVNEFADLSNEEFKAAHIGFRSFSKGTDSITVTSFGYENFTSAPPSVDWRTKGAVTPIRGSECGGWTLPAVDTVEGLTKIKTGKLYTLSFQEILDCYDGGRNGCTGGFTDNAFEFIKQHGLTTERNYPSNGDAGTCNTTKEDEPVAKISGYENVPANDENALMQAVANQPIAVMVDASGPDFQFYSGGVFTGNCGTAIDHGVALVGYGTSDGELKYWLIKNSWTVSWGEKGYMRMQRDIAAKEGLCGIAMEATFPTM